MEAIESSAPHVIVTHPLEPADNPGLYRLLGSISGQAFPSVALRRPFPLGGHTRARAPRSGVRVAPRAFTRARPPGSAGFQPAPEPKLPTFRASMMPAPGGEWLAWLPRGGIDTGVGIQ